MKLTLKLTLDGLLRALRMQAHRVAEEIERSSEETRGEVTANDRGGD